MGCPSAAIVMEELIQLGVKRFLRVGTCGGLQPDLSLGVALDGAVEVRLGDVPRAQRIAGKQAGLGVVASFGADVDRHAKNPKLTAPCGGRATWSSPD
jgi:uridine phosphorylase